jgi:hypothetical protein
MVETLDEKIKEAEQKIITTKSKYERLAMMKKLRNNAIYV